MKKIIIWVVVILVVISVVWVATNKSLPPTGTTSEPIRVGFIGPLTGSLAGIGEEQKNTIEMAVAEINKNGGIRGRQLEFVYEDGKCDGKEASIIAQKLINVEKLNILMPVCSSESMTIAPIAEQNHVLEFAVWPTTPAFSGIGTYTFRNSYSDEDTGRIMAETISAKYKTVAIISELTDYTVGLRDSFKKYFAGEVFEEGYQPDSHDLRTIIAKIISHKPQAVLINPNSPDSGLAALKQLAQQSYKGSLFGNFFGTSNAVISAKEAEGMIFFADPAVGESKDKARFLSDYASRYGTKPNFEFAVAAQYDAVFILKQAIEVVGSSPTAIRNYLHELRDFHGLLGIYGFNEQGDMIGAKPSVRQIKSGQIVVYKP